MSDLDLNVYIPLPDGVAKVKDVKIKTDVPKVVAILRRIAQREKNSSR